MVAEALVPVKKTEVGEIPEDWEVVRLADVGYTIIGLTYNPKNVKSHGTLVLRSSNIQQGKLAFEDNVFVVMDLPERVIVREGDVLICVRNGSRQLIGKCALIDKRTAGSAFGAFMSIYRSEFGAFIFHQLKSDMVQRQINETLGATINQLTNRDLAGFLIALPPTTEEQQAIATALNDADSLIASLERLIAKKEAVRQGAMQELLTPKDGWKVMTVGRAFNFMRTANNSRADLSESYSVGYIHYGDIHTKWSRFLDCTKQNIPGISTEKVISVPSVQDGDLVMADASENNAGLCDCIEIQNVGNRKIVAGLHTFLLRADKTVLVDGFKGYFKQYAGVKQSLAAAATGVSVYSISKSALAEIEIPIPPPTEQTRIATILSGIDTEIAALQARLAKTRLIKTGMMQQLLTGKKRLVATVAPQAKVPKIIELPQPAPKTKGHNWQINEAVVIGVLAARFGTLQFPLTRFRYTKFSYLMHRHIEKVAEGYLKKAAGPYNPKTRYGGPEKIALQNKYVAEHSNGTYTGFIAGEGSPKAASYFAQWYGAEALDWLSRFQYTKKDELELIATVDMAVEDLKAAGRAVSMPAVKEYIYSQPEWKAKLKREIFSDANIERAIKGCAALFAD